MSKIRWGILSTAKIGVEKVIPAMQRGPRPRSSPSRRGTGAKAKAAAEKLGIAEGMWITRGLTRRSRDRRRLQPLAERPTRPPVDQGGGRFGKHVLCEKPIGLSAAEGRTLVDAAAKYPKLKLMEAFMYRHHPQWQKAKELVQSKQIGKLRTIQTFFSYYSDDPHNIRHDPAMGGGGLMDIGCYAISLSRWLFEAEPARVFDHVELRPATGIDRMASPRLDFGDKGSATFPCSMAVNPLRVVQVVGTEGRIELSEVPFNAPNKVPCAIKVQKEQQAIDPN